MKRARALLLLSLAVIVGACADEQTVQPTGLEPSASHVGAGVSSEAELQAALDAASAATHRSTIILERGAVISLTGTLSHTGSAPLNIFGRGATILGPDEGNAMSFTGGANLSINDLTVEGAAEHGVYVEVPASRMGTLAVNVRKVALRDNGFAGLWIDDQVYDSPASISLRVMNSRISGNNTAGIGEEC